MAKKKSSGTPGPRKKINSRSKGQRGEIELADFLSARGFDARRGQQFSGGSESADVVCEALANVHWEVKRVEAGNPYHWLEQATRDAGAKLPVVAHRRNNKQWIAIVDLDALVEMLALREGSLL